MNEDKFVEMLNKDYNITLPGGVLGYILKMVAEQQGVLNREMRKNITDAMAAMMAAANDVVGNTLLHEIYRVAGAEFLAHTMGTKPAAMQKLMDSQTRDEMEDAARDMGIKVPKVKKPPRGAHLN